jgi:hypothetical protein
VCTREQSFILFYETLLSMVCFFLLHHDLSKREEIWETYMDAKVGLASSFPVGIVVEVSVGGTRGTHDRCWLGFFGEMTVKWPTTLRSGMWRGSRAGRGRKMVSSEVRRGVTQRDDEPSVAGRWNDHSLSSRLVRFITVMAGVVYTVITNRLLVRRRDDDVGKIYLPLHSWNM